MATRHGAPTRRGAAAQLGAENAYAGTGRNRSNEDPHSINSAVSSSVNVRSPVFAMPSVPTMAAPLRTGTTIEPASPRERAPDCTTPEPSRFRLHHETGSFNSAQTPAIPLPISMVRMCSMTGAGMAPWNAAKCSMPSVPKKCSVPVWAANARMIAERAMVASVANTMSEGIVAIAKSIASKMLNHSCACSARANCMVASKCARTSAMESPPNFARNAAAISNATTHSITTLAAATALISLRSY